MLITSELNKLKQLFNALKCNILSAQMQCVLEAVSGFTNFFSSSFTENELYFLSFGVSAELGIARDLIGADGICRKAVADFTDSLLVVHLSFTTQ